MGKNYRIGHLDCDSEYINSLTEESINLSNFFKYALTDIPALKVNDKSRQDNEIGKDDFEFKNQIKFHKFLIETIRKTPPKNQIKNKFYEILQKAEKLNLRYYFPIVINAIASLYQIDQKNYAKNLLKLKDYESFNVVSDMVHPLRAISLGYRFMQMCNVLDKCEFCFFSNDKYLKNFYIILIIINIF